jgi:hypothetical protein
MRTAAAAAAAASAALAQKNIMIGGANRQWACSWLAYELEAALLMVPWSGSSRELL